MTAAAALALPMLPIEDEDFLVNPLPHLEAARCDHRWLARFAQGYIVHGYKEVCDLLADGENLTSGFGPLVDFYAARGTMWGRFMEGLIMARPGASPEHKRLRGSINRAFTPRRAGAARALIRRIVSALLDEWVPRGSFDFAEFAANIPVSVVFGLLGVSTAEVPRLKSALENQLLSVTMNPVARPLFMAGWDELWEFADRLVREREDQASTNSDDLLGSLIAASRDGELDEIELRFMVLTLVVGGYDTTKNQLTMTMRRAIDHPELYARCGKDLEFAGRFVDEALRHAATVTPFRRASHDFTYDRVTFHEGETLIMATPLAGLDPEIFPDPDRFDPDRPNLNRHVGFGRGAHICVGQFLARAILQESLHQIAIRLRNPRISGNVIWRPFLIYGIDHMPITYDA